jgi:hypothetical protein
MDGHPLPPKMNRIHPKKDDEERDNAVRSTSKNDRPFVLAPAFF